MAVKVRYPYRSSWDVPDLVRMKCKETGRKSGSGCQVLWLRPLAPASLPHSPLFKKVGTNSLPVSFNRFLVTLLSYSTARCAVISLIRSLSLWLLYKVQKHQLTSVFGARFLQGDDTNCTNTALASETAVFQRGWYPEPKCQLFNYHADVFRSLWSGENYKQNNGRSTQAVRMCSVWSTGSGNKQQNIQMGILY